MINRKTIAAIALVATGAAAPVFADDGDVRHAEILLEQARTYGKSSVTGKAAGEVRAERTREENLSENEKRWREIAKSQSLN